MADGFGTAQMTPEKLRGTQCKQIGEDTKGSCPALEQLCSAVLAVAQSQLYVSSKGQGFAWDPVSCSVKLHQMITRNICNGLSGCLIEIGDYLNFKEATFARTRGYMKPFLLALSPN